MKTKICKWCLTGYPERDNDYTVFCDCGAVLFISKANEHAELKILPLHHRIKPFWGTTKEDWVKAVAEKRKELFKKPASF